MLNQVTLETNTEGEKIEGELEGVAHVLPLPASVWSGLAMFTSVARAPNGAAKVSNSQLASSAPVSEKAVLVHEERQLGSRLAAE